MFVLLDHAWFTLTGPDAERYLQGQVTADVRAIGAHEVLPACLCDHKAALQALVWIRRIPAEVGGGFRIDCPLELAEIVHARLERYLIADNAVLVPLPGDEHLILVHLVDDAAAAIPSAAGPAPSAGSLGASARANRFGRPGLDLIFPAGSRDAVLAALEDSGQREATPAALDGLRIDSLTPAWGAELVPGILAPEAGLGAPAISLSKGCYLGQEVFSRLKSVGRARRLLARVEGAPGSPDLIVGAELFLSADATARPAGRLTTVAADGRRALAIVSRAIAERGEAVWASAPPAAEKPLCSPLRLAQTLEPFAR